MLYFRNIFFVMFNICFLGVWFQNIWDTANLNEIIILNFEEHIYFPFEWGTQCLEKGKYILETLNDSITNIIVPMSVVYSSIFLK